MIQGFSGEVVEVGREALKSLGANQERTSAAKAAFAKSELMARLKPCP